MGQQGCLSGLWSLPTVTALLAVSSNSASPACRAHVCVLLPLGFRTMGDSRGWDTSEKTRR